MTRRKGRTPHVTSPGAVPPRAVTTHLHCGGQHLRSAVSAHRPYVRLRSLLFVRLGGEGGKRGRPGHRPVQPVRRGGPLPSHYPHGRREPDGGWRGWLRER